MLTLVVTIHVIIALFLIVFVLLQDSKGGAMGALTGGGSNTLFGSTGASGFLVKATRLTAILFAATCIILAYLSTPSDKSVTDKLESAPAAAVQDTIETSPKDGKETDATPIDEKSTPAEDAK